MINFGISWWGVLFLMMLLIPNSIWTKHQPIDDEKIGGHENRTLLLFERIGQIGVSASMIVIADTTFQWNTLDSFILILALSLMLLYEIWWLRYFQSKKTLYDFYQPFLGIPTPGATLPVIAFFLLGIYNRNWFLLFFTGIFGIGHISIHVNHSKAYHQFKNQ